MAFAEVDEDTAAAGALLILSVNDDGLLGTGLESILEQNPDALSTGMTVPRLETALEALQHWLEPPGLAARSIQECLILQVEAMKSQGEDAVEWEPFGN